jgi:hypothetical protein
MKLSNRTLLTKLFILAAVMSPPSRAQTPAQKTAPIANAAGASDAEKKNIQAYINLMRKNVRQDNAGIMGATMVLSAADAAKFWPVPKERRKVHVNCSMNRASHPGNTFVLENLDHDSAIFRLSFGSSV